MDNSLAWLILDIIYGLSVLLFILPISYVVCCLHDKHNLNDKTREKILEMTPLLNSI